MHQTPSGIDLTSALPTQEGDMTGLDPRIAVTANHDITQPHITVRCGTSGLITDTTGTSPTYYTVIFLPLGVVGPEVAIDHLTRFDLREA